MFANMLKLAFNSQKNLALRRTSPFQGFYTPSGTRKFSGALYFGQMPVLTPLAADAYWVSAGIVTAWL